MTRPVREDTVAETATSATRRTRKMSDLISKRSATERLIIAKTLLESVLQDMPAAEPNDEVAFEAGYTKAQMELKDAYKPRKGKWLSVFVDGLGFNGLMFECSECGKRSAGRTNFCAYCGADMRGERNEP